MEEKRGDDNAGYEEDEIDSQMRQEVVTTLCKSQRQGLHRNERGKNKLLQKQIREDATPLSHLLLLATWYFLSFSGYRGLSQHFNVSICMCVRLLVTIVLVCLLVLFTLSNTAEREETLIATCTPIR